MKSKFNLKLDLHKKQARKKREVLLEENAKLHNDILELKEDKISYGSIVNISIDAGSDQLYQNMGSLTESIDINS